MTDEAVVSLVVIGVFTCLLGLALSYGLSRVEKKVANLEYRVRWLEGRSGK